MEIILVLIGVIIGAGALYALMRPKMKTYQTYDIETLKKNEELQEKYDTQLKEYNSLLDEFNVTTSDYEALKIRKSEIIQSINDLQKQAEVAGKELYSKNYEIAALSMESAAERLSRDYQEAERQVQEQYLETLDDCVNSFQKQIEIKQKELAKVEEQLFELAEKLNAAVEANKRAEEIKKQQDFYKLNLSPEDIEEIIKLREVVPYLRNAEALNKVIWKVYYEKAYTDLIGRVVGTGTHTGIYKITNLENQKCYIGQAANIADRWKQHIKRGIGAETATRNKLYPAMLKYGVENFTFEIVEECDRSLLNEREDYWQDYFHAKDFGYSIK